MRWFKKTSEQQLEGELRFHMESAIEAKVASGLTPEEARRAVAIEFGGAVQIKEECRDVQRAPWIEHLFLDARYGFRSLLKNPGFTFLAVLILGVGIGANTAIFTVVNSILLRPLPYPKPEQLLSMSSPTIQQLAAFVRLRDESKVVSYAACLGNAEVNLIGDGEPARLPAASVSANLFRVLGVEPWIGDSFRDGDDGPKRGGVMVISHQLFESRFHGDPSVIGRSLMVDDQLRRVIGVMPPTFAFPTSTTQVWIPLDIDPTRGSAYWWSGNLHNIIGRLRPGADAAQAQAEMLQITGRLKKEFYGAQGWAYWGRDTVVRPMRESMVAEVQTRLWLLLGAVGLVLLIACANFANLLLVRTTLRRRELAVRAALGATRWRIIQQVLLESVIVASVGGAAALGVAQAGTALLIACLPAGTPRITEIGMDWHALAFTAVVSVVTGIVFGLLPAIRASKPDPRHSLQIGGRSVAGGRRVLLTSFVTLEIAVSVVVVMGAGLLAKTLWLLSAANPGFQADHLLTFQVTPNDSLCQDRIRCAAFYRDLIARARMIPGVINVSAASALPLSGDFDTFAAESDSRPFKKGSAAPSVWTARIAPDYLDTMKIPVLEGRAFLASDFTAGSAPVLLVSAFAAKRFWPGENPIGKRLRGVWQTEWHRVVGVVGDVKATDLSGDPAWLEGAVYFPYTAGIEGDQTRVMTMVVRTAGDPLGLFPAMRRLVAGLRDDVPVNRVQSMQEVVEDSIVSQRSTTWLLNCFALLALLLAAVGIYAVVSYTVAQRVREIGVRMALGAVPSHIGKLIIGENFRRIAIGLALGVPTALFATKALASQLYGVGAADPSTYVMGCAVVILVALAAAWVPARRAMKLDPAAAIHQE
jgi:putative ABC transport system permease protein